MAILKSIKGAIPRKNNVIFKLGFDERIRMTLLLVTRPNLPPLLN